jgi:hypothetical protein
MRHYWPQPPSSMTPVPTSDRARHLAPRYVAQDLYSRFYLLDSAPRDPRFVQTVCRTEKSWLPSFSLEPCSCWSTRGERSKSGVGEAMKQAHDVHPHLQHWQGSSYSKSKALFSLWHLSVPAKHVHEQLGTVECHVGEASGPRRGLPQIWGRIHWGWALTLRACRPWWWTRHLGTWAVTATSYDSEPCMGARSVMGYGYGRLASMASMLLRISMDRVAIWQSRHDATGTRSATRL